MPAILLITSRISGTQIAFFGQRMKIHDDLTDRISETLHETMGVFRLILTDEKILGIIRTITEQITNACKRDNKVLICGNGGSAADAQHIAAELSGKFFFDRQPLFAEALHVNTSYMTAVANDYSYEDVFARLIKAQGKEGDILIALSTSGNSKNIIKALHEANAKHMTTIGFTGEKPNAMENLCDHLVTIPSRITPRIQECHMTLCHIICELVENDLFSTAKPAVFLDRDGVINTKMPEGDYVKNISEFEFLPDIFEAVRLLNDGGYLVFVVSNQQCVGKGIITMDALQSIHSFMTENMRTHNALVQAVYVCPHTAAENCSCRKPAPGLIEMAIRDFQ
ncbi:MAG: HAD-IIIA family hydrolase, partial [Syntrophorhabdaceae bacterium]